MWNQLLIDRWTNTVGIDQDDITLGDWRAIKLEYIEAFGAANESILALYPLDIKSSRLKVLLFRKFDCHRRCRERICYDKRG